MTSSLLALINFVAMLLIVSCLAQAIAQNHWQRRGTASVLVWIVLAGQVWLIPQAISFLGFHSTRFLYPLWFGNWLTSAAAVVLFCLIFRSRSRDLVSVAQLDGLGAAGIYRHVVWPTAKPALSLLAIILFMATWSEFARPFLPVGGSNPSSNAMEVWPLPASSQAISVMIGASILATLPVIAVFFLARQRFLRALHSSAS